MFLDGHIHITGKSPQKRNFLKLLKASGINGGAVISLHPDSFYPHEDNVSSQKRLDDVMWLCEGEEHLFPFFFIDPIAEAAEIEITMAVNAGIAGFKVICDRFYPEDSRAMKTFQLIADTGRPILFHSGTLWDGKPSSKYNQPVNFEALLDIKNLRFSLAHISWPWTDGCIALYGKFYSSLQRNPAVSCKMFIDITPGTPAIYRENALRTLYTVGYDIENNVIFGSDAKVEDYGIYHVHDKIDRDVAILKSLHQSEMSLNKLFADNLISFISGD
ncbi:MAG: amidohydrolase family protein [Victivallaceae bacterium]|nr:amidohydrolase family protein [Victivallaceae bacterium]